MLRRGASGRSAVVVGYVVVDDRAPANATQTAQDARDDGGEGFGVGHAQHRGPALASCQPRGGGGFGPTQAPPLNADTALTMRLRYEGHTCTSLASLLGVSETTAKRLLRGERRWTDYQRAKLAKGAA